MRIKFDVVRQRPRRTFQFPQSFSGTVVERPFLRKVRLEKGDVTFVVVIVVIVIFEIVGSTDLIKRWTINSSLFFPLSIAR